jgi:aconitase A
MGHARYLLDAGRISGVLLEDGETGISAKNRNYKGRVGHIRAMAYLASPAVVTTSAVKGYICGPDELLDVDGENKGVEGVRGPVVSIEIEGAMEMESDQWGG